MTDPNLLDYIRKSLELGTKRDEIIQSLLNNEWQRADVDEAFSIVEAGGGGENVIPVKKEEPGQSAILSKSRSTDSYKTSRKINVDPFNPEKEKPRTTNYILVIIISLLVLTLGGAVVYFVTSGSYEKWFGAEAEWEVFTSSEYNFSISFPREPEQNVEYDEIIWPTLNGDMEKREVKMYSLNSTLGSTVYIVLIQILPEDIKDILSEVLTEEEKLSSIYEGMKSAFPEGIGEFKNEDSDLVNFKEMEALEFNVEGEDIGIKGLIVSGQDFDYIITVRYSSLKFNQDNYDTFINSFIPTAEGS